MKADIWAATQPAVLDDDSAPEQRSPLLDAKVMMVDDEPLMTDLIQTHLEDEGYTNFVVANDPREVMTMLRREKPGVLLLDLMMPGISGFELLEAMRRDRELRYTPVIVLTAATGADSKLRALRLGATDFLSKPVDASELVLRVRNTLAFHQYHERLLHFDQVTGLPNERLFEASVDGLLADQHARGGLVAMFSITVPECGTLRESIDRRTADALASTIAQRLEHLALPIAHAGLFSNVADRRPRVARLDVQHFGVVIEGLESGDAVEAMAKKLHAELTKPVLLGLHEVASVPWIGIAVAPGDGQSAATLRQSADLAASHGRQQGTAPYSFASPELNSRSYQRLTLGTQLRGATQRDELRLHYQPKVDFGSGRIVGVEALVRWQHPEHGLVPPLKFIPLAEELGLMAGIGQWVMERACRDAAGWLRSGLGEIKVAVNVAKPQFVAGDLVRVVRQALFDSGLPARLLVIELTESMLMDKVEQSLVLMHELKALGATLSIDDFGTGYSSLSYLKQFPLDELKIDRSFVIDLPGAAIDVALVRAVVDLGHSLGMSVLAEGVETEGQRDCLKQLACDAYQGYLFSRPLALEQCTELLVAKNSPAG